LIKQLKNGLSFFVLLGNTSNIYHHSQYFRERYSSIRVGNELIDNQCDKAKFLCGLIHVEHCYVHSLDAKYMHLIETFLCVRILSQQRKVTRMQY